MVPGSMHQGAARSEGLDKIFLDAGFEWRDAGCSMCLAMNPDVLPPGERSRQLPIVISKAVRGKAAARTW